MRNFARINNYYNNIEAAKEYAATVRLAEALGIEPPILPNKVGWRQLDKVIADLKAKIEATAHEQCVGEIQIERPRP